ncbi:MAG: lipid A biosynthesis acyltransferase [Planctomycetes bacterium]|nr:lipid A biosynthesis acyltransferase [Planctomycetota bacterium]
MSGTATDIPRPVTTEAPTQARPKEWDGRTRTGLGILIFFWTFKLLGPRFAYLLLYPVAFYYVLVNRKNGRASRDYLRRRFPGLRGPRLWWKNYRHFLSFGRVLVDRGYAFLGMLGEVRFERDGHHVIEEVLASGKGVILLSAHIGNWELAAYCLGGFLREGRQVPVNAVMFKGESEKVEKQLARASGDRPFHIIASNDSLQASIECKDALARGEVVAIHGDRLLGSGGVKVPFLGSEAKFPIGPFVLAASTGAPVIFTFANRLGTRHYGLRARGPHYFQFADRKLRDRDLKDWVRMYAAELEELIERYPLQWHNFYPFWDTESGTGW